MISSRLVPQTTATWVDHDLRSKETLISTPVIHMNSYPGFLTGMISNNLSSGGANCMMQSKWHRPVLSGQCPSFWRQTHRKSRQPPSVPRHRWIELARIQMFNYIFVVLVHWLYWLYCITEESQTSPGSLKTELNHVVFIDHGLPPSNWITLDHAGSRLIMRYMYIDIIVYTWRHIYMIGTLQIHVPTLHVFSSPMLLDPLTHLRVQFWIFPFEQRQSQIGRFEHCLLKSGSVSSLRYGLLQTHSILIMKCMKKPAVQSLDAR